MRLIFIFLLCSISLLTAQSIFPNLWGQQLIDSLAANYKTNTVLSWEHVKDTLYARIYNYNDSVSCVYGGLTVYLDPTQDPSTWLWNQGRLTVEHTWPKSKGATGQAQNDMHYLFPVRNTINSSRGNDPFAESPDPETDVWWRLDGSLHTIPTQFIEAPKKLNEHLSGNLVVRCL